MELCTSQRKNASLLSSRRHVLSSYFRCLPTNHIRHSFLARSPRSCTMKARRLSLQNVIRQQRSLLGRTSKLDNLRILRRRNCLPRLPRTYQAKWLCRSNLYWAVTNVSSFPICDSTAVKRLLTSRMQKCMLVGSSFSQNHVLSTAC